MRFFLTRDSQTLVILRNNVSSCKIQGTSSQFRVSYYSTSVPSLDETPKPCDSKTGTFERFLTLNEKAGSKPTKLKTNLGRGNRDHHQIRRGKCSRGRGRHRNQIHQIRSSILPRRTCQIFGVCWRLLRLSTPQIFS